ncbi:MAG: agmatinase [Actinobacteria bacterium]|nr:MAG: agmatinase [Actinomycetota bacterium]
MRSTYWWGVPTFLAAPHDPDPVGCDVALVGVPHSSGNGSTERDQHLGPRAVRHVSAGYRRRHRRFGVVPHDLCRLRDVGDVVMPEFMVSDRAIKDIEARFRQIAAAGARPVAVGGDHSITLPILRALGSPERPLALVHLDAHLDTYDRMDTWFGVVDSAAHWASKAVHERLVDPGRSIQLGMRGHMSPWTQANVSDELGYLVLEKARCDDLGVEGVVTAILERVGDCPVYVSFDLDCLDPGIAPGVSNLEPGEDGFTMTQAAGILQGLRGRDVVGGDVVCLMPTKDNPNAITAMNATTILFELATLIAVRIAASTSPVP